MLLELHPTLYPALVLPLEPTLGSVLPRSWFMLFHVATAFASVLAVYLMAKTLLAQARHRQPPERLLALSQQLVWVGVTVLALSLLSSLANYLVATSSIGAATSPGLMMEHSRAALTPVFGGICTLIGCLFIRFHVLWQIHLGQQ